jgi:RNA polymerase sigma-70 factor (ECF subfamily)
LRVSEAAVTQEAPKFTSCPRAFEEEFDFLRRTVQRLGVWASDAEDLVQDVFVVVWRRWGDYQQDRPLRAWMVGIANHLACRHKQRRLREVLEAPRETGDQDPPAEDRLDARVALTLVRQALATLPARHRGPLVMHELEGWSVTEISRLLDVPLPTAYTRVRRARLAFAAEIARLGAC